MFEIRTDEEICLEALNRELSIYDSLFDRLYDKEYFIKLNNAMITQLNKIFGQSDTSKGLSVDNYFLWVYIDSLGQLQIYWNTIGVFGYYKNITIKFQDKFYGYRWEEANNPTGYKFRLYFPGKEVKELGDKVFVSNDESTVRAFMKYFNNLTHKYHYLFRNFEQPK